MIIVSNYYLMLYVSRKRAIYKCRVDKNRFDLRVFSLFLFLSIIYFHYKTTSSIKILKCEYLPAVLSEEYP